ncbi:tetratricopeptide (TPR) repeat protein [Planomicrobium koreense]|uniref:Tetratricopeptide (TPR) repeat protein n=1 Tax=Planococcus koreensis TaxID=112331 RepID=A0A7W8CR00_9BACL|nr:tetratricopeptide repeat protein [Planococcus koreensis]MBB5178774.1 tetratricopeptide (TPR) repeat protein [Planococcus koreensis]
MDPILIKAINLREIGQHEASNKLILKLIDLYPEDPLANYQCAWSYDLLGEEAKAVPYYEKAITLGLKDKDLEGALIGLGSTYRTLGMYVESKKTFLKGMELFPANNVMKTFYSMTLYNLEEHQAAMNILLQCLIDTTLDKDIQSFKKAIEFYSNNLNEVWK